VRARSRRTRQAASARWLYITWQAVKASKNHPARKDQNWRISLLLVAQERAEGKKGDWNAALLPLVGVIVFIALRIYLVH